MFHIGSQENESMNNITSWFQLNTIQEKKVVNLVHTLASEMSLTAAASTMFLIKLPDRLQKKTSYKTQFESWKILSSNLVFGDTEQLVQRTCLTWPLPCLFCPWFLLFAVIFCNQYPCLQRLNLSKFGRLSIATATWFSPITNQSENQDSCPRYPFQWPLPTWTKPLKNSRGGSWAINSSGIGINAWALGICACLL